MSLPISALQPLEAPPPGVYPNVPAATYHQWAAVSGSMMKPAAVSMLDLRHSMDNPSDEGTDATDTGTLLHACLLEGATFDDLVEPGPINERTGREYGYDTAKWQEALADAKSRGKMLMGPEKRVGIESMVAAARANADIRNMLASKAEREVSIVWTHPAHGFACKARLDLWLRGEHGFACNVKTTRLWSDDELRRDNLNRGYHRSAAWHLDGIKAATGEEPRHYFAYVRNYAPYAACVFYAEDAMIQCGREEMDRLTRDLARSLESGAWWSRRPTADIEPIGIPTWRYTREERA